MAVHGVPPERLRDQIDAVLEDLGVDAVKVGMLHSPDIVRTVPHAIDRHKLRKVVFDPVMLASTDAKLFDDLAIAVLLAEMFARVTLITPNLAEAGLMVGRTLSGPQEMLQAAQEWMAPGVDAQSVCLNARAKHV
jgi:hydroxymethylpyrimidine/phosphomethylpyrimidine kinase